MGRSARWKEKRKVKVAGARRISCPPATSASAGSELISLICSTHPSHHQCEQVMTQTDLSAGSNGRRMIAALLHNLFLHKVSFGTSPSYLSDVQ
jgi:hypothetical protein